MIISYGIGLKIGSTLPLFVGILLSVLLVSYQDAQAATFTVNTGDDLVMGTCDGSHCSLREAINAANSNAGLDNIRFSGSMTIFPQSQLPNIVGPVNIDGVLNTVVLNGQNAGASDHGLIFRVGASTVKNLTIIKFFVGISLVTSNNVIEGNFIGTNAAGGVGLGNRLNGIQVFGNNNAIGGTTVASRNVISGNGGIGISVSGASNTVILGNFIGTNPAGTGAVGNNFGIQLLDSPNTTIGGTAAGARNIISGNTGLGILITTNFPPASATSAGINNEEFTLRMENLSNKSISTETSLLNFDLGKFDSKVESLNILEPISSADLDSSQIITNQETELPNFSDVSVDLGSDNASRPADDKKIQPFTEVDGIVVAAFINAGSNVEGNHIGLDKNGSPLGNGAHGIQISDVPDNTIGGTTAAARNFISSNGITGIAIFGVGASGNVIQGNFIGTNLAGDGTSPNGSHGIQIDDAPNNVIGGLVPGEDCTGKCNLISGNGGAGIFIVNPDASGNMVQGNLIGTNLAGTGDLGNLSNGIGLSGPSNTIGGTTVEARNIISGNDAGGILLLSTFDVMGNSIALATQNTIQGNFIGTNKAGTGALGNVNAGIQIIDSSTNTIGGTADGAKNIISGNLVDGIQILDQNLFLPNFVAFSNKIEGNFIGLDKDGNSLGNNRHGILINSSPLNTIGGLMTGARNIISGNGFMSGIGEGILIAGSVASQNKILGNYIGTDKDGLVDSGNKVHGIEILEAPTNTVGGTTAAARNIISGNDQNGVVISGTTATGNKIEGNYIGTNVTGNGDLGNSFSGVDISDAPNNIMGGTTAQARNIISGNDQNGVVISGTTATGNKIEGNHIGTDVNGGVDLGNTLDGIQITGAPGNTIGGTTAGARNIISGNDDNGIFIGGMSATNNMIQGNFIGTNKTGTGDLGNTFDGISILGAPGNTIGGTTAGARNIISGNDGVGVLLFDVDATNNKIQGNYIGTNKTGTGDLGNTDHGVEIFNAPGNTVGGLSANDRNIISGNDKNGILIRNSGSTNNMIQGNYIGTNVTGNGDLGNIFSGVSISDAPNNIMGGTTAAARNIISGNDQNGVIISGTAATGNKIVGNYIGTNVTGNGDLGNIFSGVSISGAPNNIMGGTTAQARNIISGNDQNGVVISGTTATGNKIVGNYIGTNVTGNGGLGNTFSGVLIQDAKNNKIGDNGGITPGGACTGECNIISGNILNGVTITGNQATGNSIRFNSIHDNTLLGIDLGNDGVTPNDNSQMPANIDVDVGPNKLMNFPVGITNHTAGGNTIISGVLKTNLPVEQPVIDIYFSQSADPGGFGEGQHYWFTITNIHSDGTFQFTIPGALPHPFISATAVGIDGSTSEFSPVCTDPDGDGNVDSDGDGLCDVWEIGGIDFNGDGTIDLNLPGALWNHKDLFVEVDHMAQHQPRFTDINRVIASFNNAPVMNPDSITGITLHVELTTADTVPHQRNINLNTAAGWTPFHNLKNQFFGTAAQRADASGNQLDAKNLVFRYAMFIHQYNNGGSSGISEIGGNDFMVSLGATNCGPMGNMPCYGQRNTPPHTTGNQFQIEGTFIHEMGHTLGLYHGGFVPPDTNGNGVVDGFEDTRENCKPNYFSFMTYALQWAASPTRVPDYSHSVVPALNEMSLNEATGVGASTPPGLTTLHGPPVPTLANPGGFGLVIAGGPVDWNQNAILPEPPYLHDINFMGAGFGGCNSPNIRTLNGHNDWLAIQYSPRIANTWHSGVSPIPPPQGEIIESTSDEMQLLADSGFIQIDNDPPSISCPPPLIIVSDIPLPKTNLQIQTFLNSFMVKDNLDPSPTVENDAPEIFSPGITEVTFTAVDEPGNNSVCASVVSIVSTLSDTDSDGVDDSIDNCPSTPNPGQEDADGDGVGNACNDIDDTDGDEWKDSLDNCPNTPNPGQEDTDGSGIGDACNDASDPDGDEYENSLDNCPNTPNPGQRDLDVDSVGDACDPNTEITTNTILRRDTALAGDLTVDGATLTVLSGRTLDFDFANNKIIVKSPDGKILIVLGGKIT